MSTYDCRRSSTVDRRSRTDDRRRSTVDGCVSALGIGTRTLPTGAVLTAVPLHVILHHAGDILSTSLSTQLAARMKLLTGEYEKHHLFWCVPPDRLARSRILVHAVLLPYRVGQWCANVFAVPVLCWYSYRAGMSVCLVIVDGSMRIDFVGVLLYSCFERVTNEGPYVLMTRVRRKQTYDIMTNRI